MDGKLTLLSGDNDLSVTCRSGRGSHWRCVESQDRWLGFQNLVLGGLIGHNNANYEYWNDKSCSDRRFIAKVEVHKQNEYFCLRHDGNDGYEILVNYPDDFRAMEIGAADDKALVLAKRGRSGTKSEFLELEMKGLG